MAIYDSILDTIGRTPIVRLHRLAPEGISLFAKVESFNPGGSGSSKLVILDARVRGYVGDTVTPFSYSVSGNRVTVRTPSGAATGTVSGNSLSIGGKTYHR